jgi:hypothetical protein
MYAAKNPRGAKISRNWFLNMSVHCSETIGYAPFFFTLQIDLTNSTKLIRVFYLCRGVRTMAVRNSGD